MTELDITGRLIKAFHLQVGWCRALGSEFTALLIERFIADLETGGPVTALLKDWPGHPLADAVALRLTGALHAAALSGRDPALAAQYPAARADWSMAQVWPLAQTFLDRERAWAADFLKGPPQTNETRRAIALLPGFLECAAHGPLHLLEIGASAGLNQHWDQFRYRTEAWRWGDGPGPEIDTVWVGPPPARLDASVVIASRAGCDVSPLDVRDPEQRVRLKSYVWPDQSDRLERIDAAIALAQESPPPERADAADWLAARLAGPLPEGVTVIFHSVVWQYLPETTKQGVAAAIEGAASRCDDRRRLAWLRFEPNPMLKDLSIPNEGMGVDLRLWPGGERRRLCDVDGHATRVAYVGDDAL